MIGMAALLMIAASCKKDKKDEIENAGSGFRATVESHEGTGKTHLESDLSIKWDSGDAILVKSSTCTTPRGFTTQESGATVNFDADATLPTSFYAPPYTGYYPADKFSGDQLTLPATQQYDEHDTFANGANPMAATSNETLLPFKNICGVLKLQLYSTADCQVRSISITSNTGQQLWGTGTVGFDTDNNPTLGTLTGGGSSLTLDMGSTGMSMSKEEDNPTNYYFVVPVGTLGSSFTVKVTDTDGMVWTKTANAYANCIVRSQITAMPKTQVNEMHTPVIPTVTTNIVCVDCILSFSGKVAVSGTHNCEYGFVYAKTADNSDPTIGGTGCVKFTVNTENLSGSKNFTADLSAMGFEQEVEYTVKAYGICEAENYGDKQTYVYSLPQPLPNSWTNNGGKSPFTFTVASSGSVKRVYFSQGNLQYTTTGSHSVAGGGTATGTWRFAEHQFDFIGADNKNVAYNYEGWIDLFGWGTSGWNNGNYYYRPYNIDAKDPEIGYGYGPKNGTSYLVSLTDAYANADWGVYNAISNGGGNSWRTLTRSEWDYLINSRTNHDKLYGLGRVGSCTNGLIILPDNNQWVLPPDLTFTPGVTNKGYEANVYTYSQWAQMEAAGAVFLPAAGYRNINNVKDLGSKGRYYSSTVNAANLAYALCFGNTAVGVNTYSYKYNGCCVRLVTKAN